MSETATIAKDDLDTLLTACASYAPGGGQGELREAMERAAGVLGEAPGIGVDGTQYPDSRPDGIYARVELPGYRQHTGWITEETRFGVQSAVVRDWDGREVAIVAIGPGSQVVPLPTPMRRPETRAALPLGAGDLDDDQDWDDNEDNEGRAPF